jgi:SulP family sulfate permease
MPQASLYKSKPGSAIWNVLFDVPAGVAGGLIVFAYCMSYAALIFQGDLAGGVPFLVWGFMISAAFAGLIAGALTKLEPLGFAPDSASVGVLVAVAESVGGSVKAAGGSIAEGTANALFAVWLTGILSYGGMWMLGYLRAARLSRFVPYSVVAGFLGATGVLLAAASFSLSLGHPFADGILAKDASVPNLERIAAAALLATLFMLLGARKKSPRRVVAGFLLSAGFCLIAVRLATSGGGADLFLEGVQEMRPWSPFEVAVSGGIHWTILALHLPQILAVIVVVQISNVVRVSTMEVTRGQAADLDAEFRYNGGAALASAFFGGTGASLSAGVSNVLSISGGYTRWSGMLAAGLTGALLLLKINILTLLPIPLFAGLALYLGLMLVIDSFRRLVLQRAWFDLIPALGIALICLRFGYITGVGAGIVLACIMFSYSYAKLGPVKRHVTGGSLSSHVERAKDQADILRAEGNAIHIYWISGYLFFGSSDRLFEEIRRLIQEQERPTIAYVILDMTAVPGMDSSAVFSLIKLKNFCGKQSTQLVFCGLGEPAKRKLEADGLTGIEDFANRNEALAYCETSLLASKGVEASSSGETLETWLSSELGQEAAGQILLYFKRKPIKAGDVLYRQGDPAETIDLVAQGSIAIVLKREGEADHTLRLMRTHTVVGEMGFFRNTLRAASVVAAEDGLVHSLTREAFERLKKENAGVANAFLLFIVRTLASRVDFANRETAALL